MQPSTDQSHDRRVTVVEAAAILGITPDAVRSRLRRGTLRRDEADDGTVLVILDGDGRTDQPTDRPTDQPTVGYISALKSENELLRDELVAWQEEARRKDVIIMNMTESLKALTAAPSSEPRESAVPTSDDPPGPHVPQDEERRSWWRRIFS